MGGINQNIKREAMEEISDSTKEFINSINEVNEKMDINKIKIPIQSIKPFILFDDYMRLDVRICQIIEIEKVEKKDRLYKLKINTGFDKRIVVSAIAHKFTIEQLLNKKFPFLLNLPIRNIANIESNGMILLASGIDGSYYSIGDENIENGAIVI